MVILLLFNIRETGGTRNTRKSNFSGSAVYYSTALAWNNPPISDGGATQLRQLGDIRSNPPRLVNEWASDLEATSLTRMKPAQGLILPRSNEPMSALPKTTRLAEFVAKPS